MAKGRFLYLAQDGTDFPEQIGLEKGFDMFRREPGAVMPVLRGCGTKPLPMSKI